MLQNTFFTSLTYQRIDYQDYYLFFGVFFFLELSKVGPRIVLLFGLVITYDLKKVFFRTFKPCFIRDCIISISKNTRVGDPLFAFLFLKPLFKLFSSLFNNLRIAREIICGFSLLNFWPMLFDPKVYSSIFGLYLGHNNVSGTIT